MHQNRLSQNMMQKKLQKNNLKKYSFDINFNNIILFTHIIFTNLPLCYADINENGLFGLIFCVFKFWSLLSKNSHPFSFITYFLLLFSNSNILLCPEES